MQKVQFSDRNGRTYESIGYAQNYNVVREVRGCTGKHSKRLGKSSMIRDNQKEKSNVMDL